MFAPMTPMAIPSMHDSHIIASDQNSKAIPGGHTYNSQCLLHHVSNEFTRRASTVSTNPPPMRAQYFYCSALPIDDPLSPVPPPSSNPANNTSKVPPRPFSVHDNIALEDAWRKLQKPIRSKKDAPGARFNTTNVAPRIQEHIAHMVKEAYEEKVPDPGRTNGQSFEALEPTPEHRNDLIYKAMGNDLNTAGLGKEHRQRPDLTLYDDPEHIPFDNTMPVSAEEIGNDEFESATVKKKRSWSPFRRRDKVEKPKERDDAVTFEPPPPGVQIAGEVNLGSSLPERDTSGTPFLRIPSRIRRSRSRLRSRSPETPLSTTDLGQADGAQSPEAPRDHHPKNPSPLRPAFQRSDSSPSSDDDEGGSSLDTGSRRHSLSPRRSKIQVAERARVTVGMLRLHFVHLPRLKVSIKYSF